MVSKKQKRVYWDTAASTPLDKGVFRSMLPYLDKEWGNPASVHLEGVLANKAVGRARAEIARILSAHPDEIIFTSNGTESDNLAILGLAEAHAHGSIITSEIEHKAVLEPCRYLQKKGYQVTYLPTDNEGKIDLKKFKEALTPKTFLVSIMLANNEHGAIQPIKDVAKIIRHWRKEQDSKLPYLHTDACQAGRFLDLNVEKLGVDLLTFNGSKIYGPKGAGVLYVKRGIILSPQMMGGEQESGRRSGTLNVPAIVGLAEALKVCEKKREQESVRLIKIRDYLILELKKIAGLTINGGEKDRLVNNINFSLADFEGEQLVIELDAKGFAVSSGSACSSADSVNNNVRVSLDREATIGQAKLFVKVLKEIVEKYRNVMI